MNVATVMSSIGLWTYVKPFSKHFDHHHLGFFGATSDHVWTRGWSLHSICQVPFFLLFTAKVSA